MAIFPRIVIVCPPQIKADWGNTQIGNLFDGDNLSLRINPESYTRIEEGENSKFSDYFSGAGYQQSPQRIGFQVSVVDSRDELPIALMQLSKSRLGAGYTDFSPLTIYDYCRPESKQDYDRGYAVRVGQIWVQNLSASRQKGRILCDTPPIEYPQAGRYNSGFTLKFLSVYKEVVN